MSAMTSAVVADYMTTRVLGIDTVFRLKLWVTCTGYYGLLILMGVLLGFFGVFYNWFTLKVQTFYQKIFCL